MSNGFTAQISEAQDRSQVYATGKANLADRTHQGKAIANLGATLGGVAELATDIFGNQMFDELSKARSEAFDEYERVRKKGEAGVKQGRTPVALYNATLLKKVQEIEKKFPGFAEELEDAKRKMGIRPRADAVAEQQRIQEQNRNILIQTMANRKTLLFNKDGTIDFESSLQENERFEAIMQKANSYKAKAKRIGLVDPSKHTPNFIEGYTSISDEIMAQSSILNRDIGRLVQKAVDGEGDAKAILTSLPVFISRWERTLHTAVDTTWKGKDAEVLRDLISRQGGGLLELITGSKEPKGIVANLEAYNKFSKNRTLSEVRDLMPDLMKILDLGGDEAFKIILGDEMLGRIVSGELKDTSQTFKKYLNNTLPKNLTWDKTNPSNVNLSPQDERNVSQITVDVVNQSLKEMPANADTAQWIYSNMAHIARGHLNKGFDPDSYNTLRQTFTNPNMKAMIESLPDTLKRRQLGALGFDIMNGAAKKYLEQMTTLSGYNGIKFNKSTGQLSLNVDTKSAPFIMSYQVTPAQMEAGNENSNRKLNSFLNDMAYYMAYKRTDTGSMVDPASKESSKELMQNKFVLYKRILGETLSRQYPPRGQIIPPALKNSNEVIPTTVSVPELVERIEVTSREVPLDDAIVESINQAYHGKEGFDSYKLDFSDDEMMEFNLDEDAIVYHNEMVEGGKVVRTGVTVWDMEAGESRFLTPKQFKRAKKLQDSVKPPDSVIEQTGEIEVDPDIGSGIDALDLGTLEEVTKVELPLEAEIVNALKDSARSATMGGDIDPGKKPDNGFLKRTRDLFGTKANEPVGATTTGNYKKALGKIVKDNHGDEEGFIADVKKKLGNVSDDFATEIFDRISNFVDNTSENIEEMEPVTPESRAFVNAAWDRGVSISDEGLKLISAAIQKAESGGEANPQTVKNPTTSATGFFQLVNDTRRSAAQRVINLLGADNVSSWITEAATTMSEEDHVKFVGKLSREQQETLFFANLFEGRGSDALLNKVVESDYKDDSAIAELYMQIHHTQPSDVLKKHFEVALRQVRKVM